jgi:uncharacterized protein (TIGR03437 family)
MSFRVPIGLPILAIIAFSTAFSQTYTIYTFAGGGLPVNVPGTSASLYGPQSAAVDTAGNIYFADQDTVLRLAANTGIVTVVAGSGTSGYGGDNGLATGAQLNQPHGVAIDSAGNLYIADTGNQCIRKVSNGVITTVAGSQAAGEGFSGDGGAATNAQLFLPQGVAVDSAGNLYIADTTNNRIRKVANGVITTFAGGGSSFGDNGPATSAQLIAPHGIAVDSAGSLYIADTDNERIRKVANGVITTVAGTGSAVFNGDNIPAANANLYLPQGVFVDTAGNIYIADTNDNRIRKVAAGVITTVAGNGTAGYSGDNGTSTSAEVNLPQSVAVDSAGNVYIADTGNSRIRKVATGTISTVAGNGTAGFSGDNGPATSAQFNQPEGVAVDTNGNVYVADTGNNRIREISGGIVTTLAGTGAAGFSGDSGAAASAQLNQPKGVAVDTNGNVYIADTGNNRIREISGGVITTIAGGGTSTGTSGSATGIKLNLPQGVFADLSFNVYIADTGNNLVRLVANGTSFLTTIAGTGAAGYTGDGGVPTVAELNQPQGVFADVAGNLYVADTNNNRIRAASEGSIATLAGGGTAGLGDGGAPSSAQLFAPRGIALDAAGDLFISDTGDNRIRYVANTSTLAINTVAGTGTAGFGGDNGPSTSALLNSPKAAAVDSSGNVYIADANNNRIRILTPGTPPAITPGGIVPVDSTVSVIQPGSWVSIYGSNLASGTYLWNDDFPTSLPEGGGSGTTTSVTIDGKPAYLWFVSPGQINLQVPNDTTTGSVNVVVTAPSGTVTSIVTLAPQGPSFLLLSDNKHVVGEIATSGGGYDLVGPLNTFSYNTRPVKPGETLVLFGVGFGPTNPAVPAGQNPSGAPASITSPFTVTIGGVPVPTGNIAFAGIVTEAGLYQFNLTVPANAAAGDQALQATVNGVQTPPGPVVTVQ